jgi:hypothetical protein
MALSINSESGSKTYKHRITSNDDHNSSANCFSFNIFFSAEKFLVGLGLELATYDNTT